MGSLPTAIAFIAASLLAQQPSAPGNTSGDVVVRAPERLVCRPVTRTGTRTRASAVCRTRAEWEATRNDDAAGSYSSIEAASAKLSVIGDSCTPGPAGCE